MSIFIASIIIVAVFERIAELLTFDDEGFGPREEMAAKSFRKIALHHHRYCCYWCSFSIP